MSLFYNARGADRDVATGLYTGGTSVNDAQLTNLYKRDSEGDYKTAKIRQIANTYANPGQYFVDKANAMATATASAAVIFKDEYKKLIANLIPNAVAMTRAKRLADAHLDALVAGVEEDYPSDLSSLDLKITAGKGQLANTGFSQADTDLHKK